MNKWSHEEIDFFIANYPTMGKKWCVQKLSKSEAAIRNKAYTLGLKQDQNSEFFKNWQTKAAISKIGKKRKDQSYLMKSLYESGSHPLLKYLKDPNNKEKRSNVAKEKIKKHGHCRGALGMKHSDETKKIISEKSKLHWQSMSEDQKDAWIAKNMETRARNGTLIVNRIKTTWKSGWREIGGTNKFYRSRWEANYARYLNFLKQKEEILKWEHEPETFWFEKIKRGARSYLPDFRVTLNDGSIEYHEVKGWMDDRSKTKLKRMGIYHPTVKIVLIESKKYKEIAREFCSKIIDWE